MADGKERDGFNLKKVMSNAWRVQKAADAEGAGTQQN